MSQKFENFDRRVEEKFAGFIDSIVDNGAKCEKTVDYVNKSVASIESSLRQLD